MTLKSSLYLLQKFSSAIGNFGKIYEDDLRVIFDQWPKLHLGLDALNNKKILKKVNNVDHRRVGK